MAGATIGLRTWGQPGSPGVVLVHGGSAHAGWWDHIAPHLAHGRHVVALDLSGHGDSDHRSAYGPAVWAEEVAAAARVAGDGRPVALVGHSMGGRVALVTATQHPALIGAVALIDSPLVDLEFEEDVLERRRRRAMPLYASKAEAMERFVTVPAQDMVLPYVRDHIAALSVGELGGKWSWKFDRAVVGNLGQLTPYVATLSCPVTLFRCERGILPDGVAFRLALLVGDHARVVELLEMGHHPMLDRPLALISTLRTQLAAWRC